MPAKYIPPSANTSNPVCTPLYALKTYFIQCQHLKPPFKLKFVYRLGSAMIGKSSYNVDCEQVREVVVQDVQTQNLGRLLERETEQLEVEKVVDVRLVLVPRTIGIDCAIQVDTVELDELWYMCMEQRAMYMLEYENFDDFNVDDRWYAVHCAEDVDNLWRLDPMWVAKVFHVELNSPRLCRKCFVRPRYLAHMSSAQAVEYGLGLLCVECACQCTDDEAIHIRFYDEKGYDETPSPVTGSTLYQGRAHRREKRRSRNERTQFRRFENTSSSSNPDLDCDDWESWCEKMSKRFKHLTCLDNSQLSSVLNDDDMVFVFNYVDDWNVHRFLEYWLANKQDPTAWKHQSFMLDEV